MRIVVDAFGAMPADAIRKSVCERYVDDRREKGYADNTIRIELAFLRAALRHAADEGAISHAPKLYVPGSDAVRERWLTEAEVGRLIDAAVEIHVKAFIVLAVATAARPSHILQLTWDRVDLGARRANFAVPGVAQTRKRRPIVPLNDTAVTHLRAIRELARSPYVIEWRGGRVMNIKRGIAEAARRAGIADVTPYVLRHTAGVWMAHNRVRMEEIADYMGHTSIETTRKHYAHHHAEFLGAAAGALEIKRR